MESAADPVFKGWLMLRFYDIFLFRTLNQSADRTGDRMECDAVYCVERLRRCGSSICCAVDLWKIKMFLKEID